MTSTMNGEVELINRLRGGDEAAFATLIDDHHATMVRVACLHVRDRAAAEAVVRETWLAVVTGITCFDGRSPLKTWLYRTVTDRAMDAAQRADQADLGMVGSDEPCGPAIDPSRFLGANEPWPANWAAPPAQWSAGLDDRIVSEEVVEAVLDAIADLPRWQHAMVTLRDVERCTSKEVCNILRMTETNERVLLHRARSTVRQTIEDHHPRPS